MKRYDFIVMEDSFEPYVEEYENPTGDYVKYGDAQDEIRKLRAALEQITRIYPPSVPVREAKIIAKKALAGE